MAGLCCPFRPVRSRNSLSSLTSTMVQGAGQRHRSLLGFYKLLYSYVDIFASLDVEIHILLSFNMSLDNAHSLKLFFSPGACSFALHVLLLETGLKFNLVHSQAGQFTPDFLDLNPKGRVPVLVFDGVVITEMPAIPTAISSLIPGDQFLGRTIIESARIYEWLNYLSGTLHGQGYGALWRPERFIDDSNLFPLLQKKAVQTIRQCYTFIESKFATSRSLYAVGERFTIVDPFLFVLYRWGYRVKVDMESEYPLFGEWANRLSQRKSIVEARKTHVFI